MNWILLVMILCQDEVKTNSIKYNSPVTCEEAKDFFTNISNRQNKCEVYAQCIVDAALNK